MLDFSPVRRKEMTLMELVGDLSKNDLGDLTNEMIDTMLHLIAGCDDGNVTFEPDDPEAHDAAAVDESELTLAWTLGHVIVHTTASAEESAFLAAELARGVPNHGRSRYEIPWRDVTTIAQCRERLEESRHMRLVSLELWPQKPHLDLIHQPSPRAQPRNAVAQFVSGLAHDGSHLEQIAEIVRQAKSERSQPVVAEISA